MGIPGYNTFIKNARKYGFSLYGLSKTGQTIEYRAGDDGTYQKGYPKTGARFVDNGDGTITDNATGLMWVKEPAVGKLSWNDAIDYCEALDFAGHTDWRLPNITELLSIQDNGRFAPTINITMFPNTFLSNYWTATTAAYSTVLAWVVNFSGGGIFASIRTATNYLRAVRLGVPA